MSFTDGEVSVTVTNTGKYDTDEVVQVYVRDLESPHEVRNYRLCGFKRVSLHVGEKKTVSMPLDKNTFTLIDNDGNRINGSGHYQLWCGISQPDTLSESLTGVGCLKTEVCVM